MSILERVNYPDDIKSLSIEELNELSLDIRNLIINTVIKNGGHLASSLGVVELTVALHYSFNTPYDKIIFDVGHQSYAHKILTGRKKSFDTLRKLNGECPFTRASLSPYDTFIAGHSSTSLSIATGFMRARNILKENYEVVTVIGDGALTGGMTHEALNDSGNIEGKQIIILNDNNMSISKNVGAMSDYLAKFHTKKWYQRLKIRTKKRYQKKNNAKTIRKLANIKNGFKYMFQGGMPFDEYNLKYFGPIDGHDFNSLLKYIELAKAEESSVILHVVTTKGNGYSIAEVNPGKYHSYSKPKVNSDISFSDQVGMSMCKIAKKDSKIVAVTAAMTGGTGLTRFSREYPDRFFDVGIAEGHATTMCGAMASAGLKPYFAVYSTFLQRGFDQLIHDIAIEQENVTFLIDRAGLVGPDGETHQGIFDLSYLNCVPNLTIVAPMDITELDEFIKWSADYNKPLAIRYPKGTFNTNKSTSIEYGKWTVIKKGKGETVIFACGGDMVKNAMKAIKGTTATLVNARFIKPLDTEMLDKYQDYNIITVEDNVINGGLYSSISSYYANKGICVNISPIAIMDEFVRQGTKQELFELYNLDSKSIKKLIKWD